jgi:hypothetical protein
LQHSGVEDALFAVGPNVAKLLAVVSAFCDLYASTLMEMLQRLESFKRSRDFVVLGRVTRNKGKVIGVEPSGDRRAVDICFTLMTSKPRSTSPSAMSFAGVLVGRWQIAALIGFSALGIKGVIGQVIGVEVCSNCLVVYHVGPVLGATDLEALVGHVLHLFLQLDEIGCRRQYY